MGKLKVGIIGAGRIGRMHTENIVSNFRYIEVKAVADIFADKLVNWANEMSIKYVYKDYKDILTDDEIDAVLIFSSTDTHAQIITESAEAGKHIFCEKPIDFDVNKIKRALSAVEKANVKFQIGFNRRYDHNFRRVYDLIQDGKVGDIHIVKITSRDPEPPPIDYIKSSGGLFFDMMIHDFDMARFLTRSEVTQVYASAAVLVDPAIGEVGDVDTAIVTLKFENGALGVIDNSRKAVYGYDQRVEVFGSNGCVTIFNDTPSTAVLSSIEGVISDKPKYFFPERYRDAYIEEMRDFFECILKNKQPFVTGRDGLEPVLIGIAANKSLQEGKPVKVER